MPSPGVEVGSIWMYVGGALCLVEVEYKLVGGEESCTVCALNAFGSRAKTVSYLFNSLISINCSHFMFNNTTIPYSRIFLISTS